MKKALLLTCTIILIIGSFTSCGIMYKKNRKAAMVEPEVETADTSRDNNEMKEAETTPPKETDTEAVDTDTQETYQTNDTTVSLETEQAPEVNQPFYGVWCQADKSYERILNSAENLRSLGYDARIYYTPDWSNLNKEPYYAISIGEYSTKEEANSILPNVKSIYPDAYVKYSGDKKTETTLTLPEEHEVDWTCGHIGKAFYGVWCQADKSYNEICKSAEYMRSLGFDARIYRTWDWSELNQEKYYAISIGEHITLEEANKVLTEVKPIYPEAYVKYTGLFK